MPEAAEVKSVDEYRVELGQLKKLNVKIKRDVHEMLGRLRNEYIILRGLVKHWSFSHNLSDEVKQKLEFVKKLVFRCINRLKLVLEILHKEKHHEHSLDIIIHKLSKISDLKNRKEITRKERKEIDEIEDLENRDFYDLHQFGAEDEAVIKLVEELHTAFDSGSLPMSEEERTMMHHGLGKILELSGIIRTLLADAVGKLRQEHKEVHDWMRQLQ